MTKTSEEMARIAYEAYCESVGFVSRYTLENLPSWDDMHIETQKGWEAAANSVANHLMIMERGR